MFNPLKRRQPLNPQALAICAENVASLRAIPFAELPDDDARAALIALAEAGYECYAYTPIGYTTHTIWLRSEHAWQDGRMTPAEWIARYRASVADDTRDTQHDTLEGASHDA